MNFNRLGGAYQRKTGTETQKTERFFKNLTMFYNFLFSLLCACFVLPFLLSAKFYFFCDHGNEIRVSQKTAKTADYELGFNSTIL